MDAAARRTALSLHVAVSVGWLGAVLALLSLAAAAVSTHDPVRLHALYLSLDLGTRWAALPLCVAALLTGLLQSWITPWGVLRHWWVVAKLTITVLAGVLLLAHLPVLAALASASPEALLEDPTLRRSRVQMVLAPGAASLALGAATALSVFKPRGLTPRGRKAARP
ncbi:MAG TPA: hypothetical protein VFH47_02485 [Candidatus Thermoplasmatota archaeon]|nr:hypothetical protein [Candidatus Thermoplasmatota archaeon]